MSNQEILPLMVQGIRKSATRSHERFRNKKRRHENEDTSSLRTIVNPDLPQEYEIKVYTGDVFGASTSANVFVVLVSTPTKESKIIFLNEENDVNKDPHVRFTRGQKDTFRVRAPPLGEIERIRVGHDGTGTGAGWFLEKVEITDLITGAEFTFPCGRWLAVSEDDFQLVRELCVEHATSLVPRDFAAESADEFDVQGTHGLSILVKDFAPKVFRNIREMYDIHYTDYMTSWTLPDDKMQLKEGAGRSGSLFLKSNDGKYMLKTIQRDEVTTFLEILPKYYQHLEKEKSSLIMKVLGLMRVRTRARLGDLWVIIFCSCLWSPSPSAMSTMCVYDLKGRRAKPGKALQNLNRGPDYVFKDKDLDRKFYLDEDVKSGFFTQITKDINFFKNNNLMDYSFLIGVSKREAGDEDSVFPPWVHVRESVPGLQERYHVGFIDCLTNYGFKKKTAHMFKSALWNVDTLSTINAPLYADRIRRYLFSLFDSDPLHGSSVLAPALRPTDFPRRNSRGSWWGEDGDDSADNLLVEKKVEILERKVTRLETHVMVLTSLMTRLLGEDEAAQDPAIQTMLTELRKNPSIGSLVSMNRRASSAVPTSPRMARTHDERVIQMPSSGDIDPEGAVNRAEGNEHAAMSRRESEGGIEIVTSANRKTPPLTIRVEVDESGDNA